MSGIRLTQELKEQIDKAANKDTQQQKRYDAAYDRKAGFIEGAKYALTLANGATKPHEKALPMCGVVLRSEQLLAYHKWYLENRGTVTNSSPEAMVRMYLSQ